MGHPKGTKAPAILLLALVAVVATSLIYWGQRGHEEPAAHPSEASEVSRLEDEVARLEAEVARLAAEREKNLDAIAAATGEWLSCEQRLLAADAHAKYWQGKYEAERVAHIFHARDAERWRVYARSGWKARDIAHKRYIEAAKAAGGTE